MGESNGSKRVVVLGGCGFIGSHICRALIGDNRTVRIFDRMYVNRKLVENIEAQVEIVEADISRTEDVVDALRDADTVIDLIHTTVPGSSMNDPAYDVESNVVASVRWLSRLGETSVRKLIFVSSGGTVYGLPQIGLINERHPTDPINSYGITKLAIEKYVAMYASMSGIDYVIMRPSNVYGEGQRLHIGQGVIGVLIDRALHGESFEVWGTGDELRDYLYIDDFVAAVMKVMEYVGPHRVFNVGAGVGRSVRDIIAILQRELGRREITYKPARGFDVPVNVLDASLLSTETGWKPRVPLEQGVVQVLSWLKE
jgi:UDP-glucose 4-epimerase